MVKKAPSATDKKIISNVAKLDSEHPIPFEKKGLSHFARKSYRYIPFIGDSDNFFETLVESKLLSTTCNACVSTKTKYSVGSGWTFGDEAIDKEFKKVFANKVNKKGEKLNSILKKIFDNLYTSGNVFINIVRATTGDRKGIRIYVKNNFDSRLAYSDDPDVVEQVIFSSQFRQDSGYTVLTDDQIEVPLFFGDTGMKWGKDKKGNEHICIHIKNETSGLDHYGLPSNVASLLQQQLEYKGARYNIDNFENNLVIGGIVYCKSSMTETEAKKHSKKIVETHSGDGKRGRYLFMASEGGIDDISVVPFEKQNDGSFIELDKRLEEKIIVANEWDATLAGIKTGSSLGRGTGYFKEIFEVKYNSVIRPEQNNIIEMFLNPLLEIIDAAYNTKFSHNKIDIVTPMPISFGSDIDVNGIMTVNEGREFIPDLKGKPLGPEIGNKLIGSSKSTTNVSDKPAK